MRLKSVAMTVTLTTCLAWSLACGGAGGSAEPTHGSIAFTTYESGKYRMRFDTDDAMTYTWRNMSGSAVKASYTHTGDEVEITIPDDTENSGQRLIKLRQLDECSMAQYSWTGADGEVHDDSSKIYERTKPKCKD